ncbi:MAG: hypothetical protein DRQ37_07950 [Gammaproteobacteria bacterium]|nr:MAG: hypothetical protein DRQ37_07950 [Gammaproteobacteria bacterium]
MKRTMVGIISGALLALPAVGLACSAAGEGVHLGQVMGVDKAAGTFTIRDAQTGNPITFMADDGNLKGLDAGSGVTVEFEEAGDALKAIGVK